MDVSIVQLICIISLIVIVAIVFFGGGDGSHPDKRRYAI